MPGRHRYEALDSRLARFWFTPSRRPPDKRRSHTRKVINTAIHNWTGLAFESQRRFCLGEKKLGSSSGRTGHVWFGSGRATSARQAHMTSALSTLTASCSQSSVAVLSAGICTRRRESELNLPKVRFSLTRLHVQHRSHASPFSTSMPHFTAVQGGSD